MPFCWMNKNNKHIPKTALAHDLTIEGTRKKIKNFFKKRLVSFLSFVLIVISIVTPNKSRMPLDLDRKAFDIFWKSETRRDIKK